MSAVIAAIVSVLLKRFDYKNDYYKNIINRRLNVYTSLEQILFNLKATEEKYANERPYYKNIASISDIEFIQDKISHLLSSGIWINIATLNIIKTINSKLSAFSLDISQETDDIKLTHLLQEKYIDYYNLFENLEKSIKEDLSKIHKVESFFK